MDKLKLYSTILLVMILGGCLSQTTTSGLTNPGGTGGTVTPTIGNHYTASGNFTNGQSVYAIFTGTNVSNSADLGTISINGNISKNIVGPQSIIDNSIKRIDIGTKLRDIDPKFKELTTKEAMTKNLNIQKSSSTAPNTFNVTLTNNSSAGESVTTVNATLIEPITTPSGKTVNIWFDTASDYSNIDKDAAINIGREFFKGSGSDDIYHWITNIFGDEWGVTPASYGLIDNTNTIDILFTKLNTNYQTTSYVMGYFDSRDTFKDNTDEGFPTSNKKNMFYIDANLVAGKFKYSSGTPLTDADKLDMKKDVYSTLAHEFVHMINWYQKDIKQGIAATGKLTETWLNEMMAMIGEDLIDNKIAVDGVIGVGGSKVRIPQFNVQYNNYDINDKDSNYDIGDYAIDAVYGLYLTRAYGYNNLNFIKNIMQNPYSDYRAIESAISKIGNSETFVKTLENFGKAVILSSADGGTTGSPLLYMNRAINSQSWNGTTYTFEPINVFSSEYVKTPFAYKATGAGFRGGANTYAELRKSTDTNTSESWSFTVPNGVSVQFVVKNANGSYNLTKTTELNNNVVIN